MECFQPLKLYYGVHLIAKSYHLQVIADFQLVLLQFDITHHSISGFSDPNSETSTEPLVAKYHAGTRELELSRRSSRQSYGHRGIHSTITRAN